MTDHDKDCAKTCKNSCATLQEALRNETGTVRYYEGMMNQCCTPDVKEFLSEMIEARRIEIMKIIQKLNEIQARSQIVDGVISSFDA
ncbi:MAG: hypothetical protein LC102_06160 [Ignavibacteriales bacterium]|nr:MAG: hypothetical protein F9K26_12155 [Ignavibacteriaceae bacterium]MBV6444682.1 hypothetical protein [Ignavibacteriaceae bacterium]MCZ2142993.1 hypothetical protein [Ignavibacteriales bacterium]OQY76410.1 MAG: hypothetical protein B6D45_03565 [Ignavibacteriales bacterium UTCHB3]WKZ71867.1 MAG: hypothetical protein QY308_09570 [Ignavibacteriaceae bacterium]